MSEMKHEFAEAPFILIDAFLHWIIPKTLAANALQSTLLFPLVGTADANGDVMEVEITVRLIPSKEIVAHKAKAILEAAGVRP